jgi:hypothetical protein
MSEYNKYFLLYLTTNAQSRLELTDNYIQTYNYSIDEATTKAEGRCWHYVKLIENEKAHLGLRGKWYSIDTIIGDMVGL